MSATDHLAIIGAVTAMAGGLRMSVLAEGVETAEQLGMLRQLGCKQGQGYLFSKPLPIDELKLMLGSRLRFDEPALSPE